MSADLTVSCQTNRPYYPVLPVPQLAYLLIDVRPGPALGGARLPLNLGLVLDCSGSMAGAKIRNLREAAQLAVEQLSPGDRISIVTFQKRAKLVAASQPVAGPEPLKQRIDGIRARGGTRMAGGMAMGIDELRKGLAPDRASRMLLLTDGQTFGDEEACRELAQRAGQDGIAILALGLGEDWNHKLLDAIAGDSGRNGMSDQIEYAEQIVPAFGRAVSSMRATVATNVQLLLRLVQGATPRQVWQVLPLIANLGHQPLSEQDVQVVLGDLGQEAGRQILVEVLLPARQPGQYRVAQAEVTYDLPGAGLARQGARADIVVGYGGGQALVEAVNPAVLNVVEKVTAFKLQTRALQEAEAGNVRAATAKLRAAATRLLNLGENALATAFLEEADSLEQTRRMTDAGTKRLHYQTRKLARRDSPGP